jgi:hypothetical protein
MTSKAADRAFWTNSNLLWRTAQAAFVVLVGVGSSVWSVRAYMAEHDAATLNHFTTVETEVDADHIAIEALHAKVDKEIIPRAEVENYWREERERFNDLRQDLRDLRGELKGRPPAEAKADR